MHTIAIVGIGIALSAVTTWPSIAAPQQTLTAADVNDAQWAGKRHPRAAVVLKAQILLDRARISPGEIDGKMGENTRKAVRAFRALHALRPGERIDEQVWQELTRDQGDPVLTVPDDYRDKASMKGLDYTSPLELLAERFHMSQNLLRQLNPDADFGRAGREITAASVERRGEPGAAFRVEVEARAQTVTVYG